MRSKTDNTVSRQVLTTFLDELLRLPPGGHDSSNNGLQVEGNGTVHKVVFGVDACATLFERAAEAAADYIIVHHGLSWGDNQRYLTGIRADRLKTLFGHGISLYASHLPLDMHPEIGHNAVIARRLGLRKLKPFFKYGSVEIGCCGELPHPLTPATLAQRVNAALHTVSELLAVGPSTVHRVGVVSGGGADAAEACAEQQCEALVTGEIGHSHVHPIREAGVNVIAAGHYRSEVPGLEALMERVSAKFHVACEFIDVPTGR